MAREIFSDFTSLAGSKAKVKKVTVSGEVVEVGRIAAIVYESFDNGKKKLFRHDFKKSARPSLGINGGGNIAFVGSGSRFNDRGIVDK